MGATGSGKTTFLQLLNGLLQPTRGKIFIDNKSIFDSDFPMDRLRTRIGMVFQFPEMQFFEENVFKDVAYGPQNLGLDRGEVLRRVKKALEAVDLDFTSYHQKSPFHLSSGEKRRLAIACILALDPEMLILDEPTIGLDWVSSMKIEKIILNLHKQGRTVIFVTHDMNLVTRIARQVIILDRGSVVFKGKKQELLSNHKILKTYNLPFPDIMEFMIKIKKAGIPVDSKVYSLPQAKQELDKVLQNSQYKKKLKMHLFVSM